MSVYSEDARGFGSEKERFVAIAFIQAQYRMTKIEEIVTRSLLRVIWVGFCIYLSSTTIGIGDVGMSEGEPLGSLLAKPFGLFAIGCGLFVTSRGATRHIQTQLDIFRNLLVSSDPELKDPYVRSYYREMHFVSLSLFGREEFWWFNIAVIILLLRVAAALLGR